VALSVIVGPNNVHTEVGTFNQWVYAFRVHLDMTQKSFADYVQTTIPTVQRWEGGQHTPTGPVLLLFALLADAHGFVRPPGLDSYRGGVFDLN
jgi:DNA-binding transcriptional regulator YiaG